METWTVTEDGRHNAFTDLVLWRGAFWLAYVSSPSHFASGGSRVALLRSDDARHWKEAASFTGGGRDIRDPRLGVFRDRLFLLALLNRTWNPEPYGTVVAECGDGHSWTAFAEAAPEGWLLGHPSSPDGGTWYAPAHRIDRGAAALLRSPDGRAWTVHASIHEGGEERADETALLFLEDGRAVAVTRLESGSSLRGSPRAATLVSTAPFPFTAWSASGRSLVTRLDGPALFGDGGLVYAVGRHQPRVAAPWGLQGSIFSRKRTALFRVEAETGELFHLADLPSCGDTSYAGTAIRGGNLYISYYTNDPHRDLPWILGMLRPTRIQVTSMELAELAELGHAG